MIDPLTLKVGEHVVTMITGFVGSTRARVVAMDERRSGLPILEVLTPEGKPDPKWAQFKLKDGDYIIESRWEEPISP
jgi:hypothetical protein